MRVKKVNQSVVLSVSLYKGCYRHIRVSANDTLDELAGIIIGAFNFENDHAHAFYMNNRSWASDDCYYMAEVDPYNVHRHTCDYRISQLKLEKGDVFKFIFDFGDNWQFQCKVLRIEDTDTQEPELIRVVGEAPEQYPDYEDEETEEE